MTAWTDFVKKVFEEGKKKSPDYQFKDALKDASKRKSEMGKSSPKTKSAKNSKKGGEGETEMDENMVPMSDEKTEGDIEVETADETTTPMMGGKKKKGGKKRKTAKKSKKSKKSRKTRKNKKH